MIIDGKKVRDEILLELKKKISLEKDVIKLAIVYVGQNDASDVYIKNKLKACESVGIKGITYQIDADSSEDELIALIAKLNKDEDISGIILQSPIPKHMNFNKCSNLIVSYKDVDGFTKENVYQNYINGSGFLPCTVKGIIRLLNYYNIDIDGQNVVIVGRGNIVGKPLALALENRNATVTVANSHTKNLKDVCIMADILISATGVPNLIKKSFVKKSSVIIDVGISRVKGKLIGDVNFENVFDKCFYITPVPGGVGPMTVAMLLENTYQAYKRKKNK